WINCLLRRGADACAVARAEVEAQEATAENELTRMATGMAGVRIWSPLDALCPGGRCVAEAGGRLLYRNRTLRSSDGPRGLAPSRAAEVRWLIGARPSASPRRRGADRRL